MNNPDEDIDTIAQILMENTYYSPQVRAYIIHGAIQKLIQWRDSFITKDNTMQLVTTDALQYSGAAIQERKQFYIVLKGYAIWKGRFFHSISEAAGVIRSVFEKASFKTLGGNNITALINEQDGTRFHIYPVDEYLSLTDVKNLPEF